MSVIRVGSTSGYAAGWDFVFGSSKTAQRVKKTKGRVASGKAARQSAKKSVRKKAAKRPKKSRR
jgi:hypothetical protein